MVQIHPSAVVDPRAQLGHDVHVGPFSVIEGEVQLGEGCRVASHVVIRGATRIGQGCRIHDGVVLGSPAQHTRAQNSTGGLMIGARNVLREHVTIHAALCPGQNTILGDDNYLMVGSHVAHDCQLGDHVIMANHVLLAGHVIVGNAAFLSGAAAVHQFCRVGSCAMIGGQAHVTQDVLPYVTVDGQSGQVVGLNLIGLRRHGFTSATLQRLKEAYRLVFRSGETSAVILERLSREFSAGPASIWGEFIRTSRRGFVRERQVPRAALIRMHRPEVPADQAVLSTGPVVPFVTASRRVA